MRVSSGRSLWLSLILVTAACGGDGGNYPSGTVTTTAGTVSGSIRSAGVLLIAPDTVRLRDDYDNSYPDLGLRSREIGPILGPSPSYVLEISANGTVVRERATGKTFSIEPMTSARYTGYATGSAYNEYGEFDGQLIMLIPGEASGYDYVVNGNSWDFEFYRGTIVSIYGGIDWDEWVDATHFVFGSPTDNMPTSGTAQYEGSFLGDILQSGDSVYHLTGDVYLEADFLGRSLDGQITDLVRSSRRSYAPPTTLSDIVIDADIVGSGFQGSANYGSVAGSFYGPDAGEVGGLVHVGPIIGTFVAN